MRFRIVNFRPDRLSGWCTDPERPGETQVLHLMIDGAHAATLACDLLRPELNPAEFPNRNIGFLGQIGFEHWDGQKHHYALVVPATGEVLHERKLTCPDARLPEAEGRLYGRFTVDGPHLIRGWATTGRAGTGALPVTLEIDGQTVARVTADQPLEEVRFLGCGFGFAVPGRFFDDAEHDVRVTAALPDGGRLTVGAFRRFLARKDAPRIEGSAAVAGARLEGVARNPAHPDEALTLVVYLGDSERLRVQTDPKAGGAFGFDLAALGAWDPGADALEILAEPFGLFLDFVPADLVAQTLTARAAPAAGGGWTVAVEAPLALSRLTAAALHLPGGAAPLPLDFVPSDDGMSATAAVPATVGGLEGARLVVGACPLPLRIAAADPPPAAPAAATAAAPSAAAAAPALPAERKGLGALLAPSDARVAAGLAPLFGGPYAGGDAAWPEVAGSWRLSPDGRISGWAAELVRPERPVMVEIRANDQPLARLAADAPACLAEAGVPLPAPIGFAAELGPLLPGPGRYRIAVLLEGGVELPAAGERFLRWPPRADALPGPAALLGLPGRVLPDPAEAALLIAPPDAAVRAALGLAFLGVPLDEGHPALAPTVGGTLAALLRGPFWAQDGAGRIEDAARMLPGEAGRPPLAGVDLSGLVRGLPLTPEARAAVSRAQTWRGLLRALFSDARLFRMLLDPEDARDALILADVQRIGARAPAAPTVRLDPAARPGATLPAALRGAAAIAVYDDTGRRLLAERTGGDDRALARHLFQLRPGAGAEGGAARAPWRVLVSKGGDRWTLVRLLWEAPAEAGAAVPVIGSVRLSALEVAGRLARARLTGPDLPETLVLRLGPQRVAMARLPAAAEGEASARYAARLPQPAAEAAHALEAPEAEGPTWDLRLGGPGGPRPLGLPDRLTPAAPGIVAGPAALTGGQFEGWAVSTLFGAGTAQVVLVEPAPAAPAGADPAAPPPPPRVHAATPARLASEAAAAACGREFAASGYTLALPASILDGQARQLVLEARAGGAQAVLWSGRLAADEAFLIGQTRECATREGLRDLLLRAAAARRHGFLDAYFAAPRGFSAHVLEADDAFEILAAAILADEAGTRPARLSRLFQTLWTHAQTSDQRQVEVLASALRVVLSADTGGPAARFPHGPLAELAVDLLLTAPKANIPADTLAQFARAALTLRRLPMARAIVRAGLAEHPDATELLVMGAQVEIALGAPEAAEAMARQALEKKARHREALQVLGRALALQGRHLEAAAAVSGGRGLSAWLNRPPGYETAKVIAALDWPGVNRAVAQASDRPTLAEEMDRADAVLGAPRPPEAEGYTLVFLHPGKVRPKLDQLYAVLAPGGCVQVAVVSGQTMPEIECIGGSALLFRSSRMVPPEIVPAIFAQVRPGEAVVRIVECQLSKTGAPEGFETVGALVRAQALRAFGEVDFDTFMARAEAVLRVKTVLI